jgi:hypothetical protein
VIARSDDESTLLIANKDQAATEQLLALFFGRAGYNVEGNHAGYLEYGKGSAYGRLMFGTFAQRFKFNVRVTPSPGGTLVTIAKGMSGSSGGTSGRAKMREEYARLVGELQVWLAGASS